MARIGYARVSSVDQDLENQLAKLKSEGCEIIRCQQGWPQRALQPSSNFCARAMSWLSLVSID
jgi:hypothetical protein